jgi:ERF superfamily protein
MSTEAVARLESQPLAAPATASLPSPAGDLGAAMLAAVQLGPDGVASLKEIMAMVERREDRAAAAAYHAALAAFQAECPPIPKTSTAKFTTDNGSVVSYTFAPLDEIARVAGPCAHKHGLSWTYREEVDGGRKKTTCVMRHASGHVDDSSSFIGAIGGTRLMSESQKSSGTTTFGMRQSLRMALGLTTTDPDDDAVSDGAAAEPGFITDDQRMELESLIAETRSDIEGFKAALNVRTLNDIPAVAFDFARGMLARKVKRAAT